MLAYGVEHSRRDVGDGLCIAVAHGYKHMLLDKITDGFRREGTRRMESTLDRRHTHIRHSDELIHQSPRLPADYVQSIEQVDPQLIARTLDEGASTDRIDLLDVLRSFMEQALYPNTAELSDDEHTEVAWALEDGAYSVTRIRYDSPLYRALFRRFNGNGRALPDALAPSIIDELSGDLYVLASSEALTQRLTEILE